MTERNVQEQHLETHGRVDLYVENGRGSVSITATDTTESHIVARGEGADDVRITFEDGQLAVVAPKQRGGFFGGERRLDIEILVPSRSSLTTKLGSADLTVEGTLAEASVRTGSGDISLDHLAKDAEIETGSGDLSIRHAEKAVRVKSGSGDVTVGRADADVTISTGSGDIKIAESIGNTVVKSGSGDVSVGFASADVHLNTGSGDLVIDQIATGRVRATGASGDVVVGIPAGVPVYTDISTVSGRISSNLASVGQPEPGADFVELHAKTISGDIALRQV